MKAAAWQFILERILFLCDQIHIHCFLLLTFCLLALLFSPPKQRKIIIAGVLSQTNDNLLLAIIYPWRISTGIHDSCRGLLSFPSASLASINRHRNRSPLSRILQPGRRPKRPAASADRSICAVVTDVHQNVRSKQTKSSACNSRRV